MEQLAMCTFTCTRLLYMISILFFPFLDLPFKWHWTESQIMSTELRSKVIWEESTSQIRKMVFCESGKCENLIYSDELVITNFSQFGWSSGAPRSASGHMFCRIIPICIVKLHHHFMYQCHVKCNIKPFIRKRSILQPSHHSNTILTSLVLNCSIGSHHGHHGCHGHQGHQHVHHDWQLYNTQAITLLDN